MSSNSFPWPYLENRRLHGNPEPRHGSTLANFVMNFTQTVKTTYMPLMYFMWLFKRKNLIYQCFFFRCLLRYSFNSVSKGYDLSSMRYVNSKYLWWCSVIGFLDTCIFVRYDKFTKKCTSNQCFLQSHRFFLHWRSLHLRLKLGLVKHLQYATLSALSELDFLKPWKLK